MAVEDTHQPLVRKPVFIMITPYLAPNSNLVYFTSCSVSYNVVCWNMSAFGVAEFYVITVEGMVTFSGSSRLIVR